MSRPAVIAGASGLIGGFLLENLLGSPEYERVIALVRSPLAVQHPKLIQLKADFADMRRLDPGLDLEGADLFCTLGTTIKKAGSKDAFRAVDHDAVLNFARWGHRLGARRFYVVTALGADASSRVFYNRVKGEVENGLATVDFAETHIFRPSLLLGPRKEVRPGERVAEAVFSIFGFVFQGPLRKYRPIHAETVAQAIARTASISKGTEVPERMITVHESDAIALQVQP